MKSFQRVFLFEPRSHPKTFEIARAAHQVGSLVIGYYKELFNRARPSQYEPRLVPLIAVPGHPAYPSGHSTQAHLVAYALAEIMYGKGMQEALERLAWRVAENRAWAGVHYRSDSVAGQKLAKDLLTLLFEQMDGCSRFKKTLELARKEW